MSDAKKPKQLRVQRPEKTAQDRMPAADRPRVIAARARREWMRAHKPTRSADYPARYAGTDNEESEAA